MILLIYVLEAIPYDKTIMATERIRGVNHFHSFIDKPIKL